MRGAPVMWEFVRQSRIRDEAGGSTWVVVACGAVAAVMVAGLVQLGTQSIAVARARNTADAAALAATVSHGDAVRVATANGGVVIDVDRSGDIVTVVAEVDGERARASATRPLSAGAVGARRSLAPAMLAALARADELLGFEVPVVSGFRSRADQERLWAARHTNPYPVARPGTSRHELGLAVDVPIAIVAQLVSVAGASGLCHPLPTSDPVHFIVCPTPR